MDNFPKQLKLTALIMFLFIVAFSHTLALQQNYYSYSCPNAENIVKQIVQQRFKADRSVAAALLRMHFHDCFVRVSFLYISSAHRLINYKLINCMH